MKSLIQKYMMAIVAVMMIVGFSAFKVVETHTNKQSYQYRWYELVETDETQPGQQMLASGIPISIPPETSEEDCARTDNTGDFCAVLIEFELETTNFVLEETDVADAIAQHAKARRVATNVIAEDEDLDGYSKLYVENP